MNIHRKTFVVLLKTVKNISLAQQIFPCLQYSYISTLVASIILCFCDYITHGDLICYTVMDVDVPAHSLPYVTRWSVSKPSKLWIYFKP